ncbi:MAG: M48 family metallopeptidase [Candidatus Thiodiazotropha sp.]
MNIGKALSSMIMVGSLAIISGCISTGNLSSSLDAGMDAAKAASLSDEDVKTEAQGAIEAYDAKHNVAPSGNKYATRLNRMVAEHKKEDGLDLNFKVYLTSDINAFAMADGSIRVYSGLMDMMTDDELLFVLGHEIGHVKLGHRKQALQVAHAASAAKKGAEASGGKSAILAGSALGDLAEKLINSQFSQDEEREADDYGFNFLKKNRDNAAGAVSALKKLADLGGEHGIFSSHPEPKARAERLEAKL